LVANPSEWISYERCEHFIQPIPFSFWRWKLLPKLALLQQAIDTAVKIRKIKKYLEFVTDFGKMGNIVNL
jgi:hypothetical protein